MIGSAIRWIVIALIYLVFHFWYGGNETPFCEEEVADYVDRTEQMIGLQAAERFRAFASTDDGREFVMVNLNKYRKQPEYEDGRKTELTSREVEQLYLAGVGPKLIARAGHPLIMVEPLMSLGGEGHLDQQFMILRPDKGCGSHSS
ncbi:MAG: hypothetical protein QGH42_07280 [Kiritimatiellia bacterium]|jgi:hypothetical protein|nr:hypothetical protein [Pseudomonadales bacterium]MDP7024027.1 hypothetical protein [Kiritimatiellia bacterium]|tara:strand:- start:1152 stop:1589 length:438 start_codon:yes stop_codon:yes gene_type:complete